MRLVAIADTHLYHQDLMPLPEGDLLVHAGDLLRSGSLDELAPAAAWLRSLPFRHKILVAGNHDRCFQEHPEEARALLGPELHYLQDEALLLEGLRIWGSPWQPAWRGWAFNLPRGPALAARWAAIPAGLDLLITHCPPAGWGDRGQLPGREGCEELARAIAERPPRLHLYGHIHQDGGLWRQGPSTLVNCTTWECERGPTIIDLEPGADPRPVRVPPSGLAA